MSDVTITEFLLARIAEDEAVARAASPAPWQFGAAGSFAAGTVYDITKANAEHMTRHDPARVLAECEAKRRIVEEHTPIPEAYPARSYPDGVVPLCCEICSGHGEYPELGGWPCMTVKLLALPGADHPDSDPSWRV